MEEQLYQAVKDHDEEEVRRILRKHPEVDVNWCDVRNQTALYQTALHLACYSGEAGITSMLLACPDIMVNVKSLGRNTPFLLACYEGHLACVEILLDDPRLAPNEADSDDSGPLWWLAKFGRADIIKVWIASGREMDLGEPGSNPSDVIRIATKVGRAETVNLLKRFRANRDETRREIRAELAWHDEVAARVYALIVFLCDGLQQVRSDTHQDHKSFFRIAMSLPMELQMLLQLSGGGSMRNIVVEKEVGAGVHRSWKESNLCLT